MPVAVGVDPYRVGTVQNRSPWSSMPTMTVVSGECRARLLALSGVASVCRAPRPPRLSILGKRATPQHGTAPRAWTGAQHPGQDAAGAEGRGPQGRPREDEIATAARVLLPPRGGVARPATRLAGLHP
eukprot:scaffold3906_cov120-Isochrysis_galbana.AAC.9